MPTDQTGGHDERACLSRAVAGGQIQDERRSRAHLTVLRDVVSRATLSGPCPGTKRGPCPAGWKISYIGHRRAGLWPDT